MGAGEGDGVGAEVNEGLDEGLNEGDRLGGRLGDDPPPRKNELDVGAGEELENILDVGARGIFEDIIVSPAGGPIVLPIGPTLLPSNPGYLNRMVL